MKDFKKIAEAFGYLKSNIDLHEDGGLYEDERVSSIDLKSYPFPIGAEITVPALGSAKFVNNIETRKKLDPNKDWGERGVEGVSFGIDYYLNEFEKEYGPTDFEVIEQFGRYEIRPINNHNFDAAYERDRQKSIERTRDQDWQRSDNMGNKTDKWS
tara:strand:+ start:45 stop:512 length:468 start_codon:yes stop_codon:yes gene_type:complete